MIFYYIPNCIDEEKLNHIRLSLESRFMMFFCEVNNGIEIITETNQKILRDIIIHHKPLLFYMDSLINSNISPTVLSELIVFLLKHNCIFISETDKIYLKSKDIDRVYSSVFDTFKNPNV